VQEKLGEHGVVLFPTFPEPALMHNEIYYKFLDVSYLVTFNATEMPVTNCPVAMSSQGLPIGIQVILLLLFACKKRGFPKRSCKIKTELLWLYNIETARFFVSFI
jgi:hypothetical protein